MRRNMPHWRLGGKVYGRWKYAVPESIRPWLKVYGHGLNVYGLGVKYTVLDVNTVFDEMYAVLSEKFTVLLGKYTVLKFTQSMSHRYKKRKVYGPDPES